jgi:molybdopterin-guanine dinucleotide biosynthesis protein A
VATLLERTAGTLAAVCDEVLVVGYRGGRPLPEGLRAVPDLFPEGGSLGGIYSALRAARRDFLLAVATDMPFLSLPLLRWMLAQPRDYDVLLPVREDEAGDGAEPLHALYGKGCLDPMRRRLEGGRLRIKGLFDEVRVREVPAGVLRRLDPQGLSFFNVNTPEDLQKAREILSRR